MFEVIIRSNGSPSWWHYEIETLSSLPALCEGNPPPVTSGFPSQKATNVELWCFLWCQPSQTAEQTVERQVNSDLWVIILGFNAEDIKSIGISLILSVLLSLMISLFIFHNFNYLPEIWLDNAQYYKAQNMVILLSHFIQHLSRIFHQLIYELIMAITIIDT